jgi:HPt (histidine-containing phosphotransfer) domain-containing protein
MDTPPLSDTPAPVAPRLSALSPAARAAAGARARLLADQTGNACALRAAALALVEALDAETSAVADDPLQRAGFDRAALAQLLALTGPEVAQELLLRLAEDLRTARAALAPGAASPPPAVLRAQAHVLVGLGGSVGAVRLHEAAQALGEACRAGPHCASWDPLRDRVAEAIDAALAFLDAEGPGLPARLASRA